MLQEKLRGNEQGTFIWLPVVKTRNLQYGHVLARQAIVLGRDCLHFSPSNSVWFNNWVLYIPWLSRHIKLSVTMSDPPTRVYVSYIPLLSNGLRRKTLSNALSFIVFIHEIGIKTNKQLSSFSTKNEKIVPTFHGLVEVAMNNNWPIIIDLRLVKHLIMGGASHNPLLQLFNVDPFITVQFASGAKRWNLQH